MAAFTRGWPSPTGPCLREKSQSEEHFFELRQHCQDIGQKTSLLTESSQGTHPQHNMVHLLGRNNYGKSWQERGVC